MAPEDNKRPFHQPFVLELFKISMSSPCANDNSLASLATNSKAVIIVCFLLLLLLALLVELSTTLGDGVVAVEGSGDTLCTSTRCTYITVLRRSEEAEGRVAVGVVDDVVGVEVAAAVAVGCTSTLAMGVDVVLVVVVAADVREDE